MKMFPGFTSKYHCHRLVWFERYVTVTRAIDREKQLKGWSRTKKIALIQRENPTWADLSEDWGKEAGPSTPLLLRNDSGRDDNNS